MKILTASASAKKQRSLRNAIEVLGHQQLVVSDYKELLNVLPAHYTDLILIILDWCLPDQEAETTISRIKNDSRFESIPIIALLPKESNQEPIRAIQAGAVDCLSIDSTQQDLVTRMFECLGRAA